MVTNPKWQLWLSRHVFNVFQSFSQLINILYSCLFSYPICSMYGIFTYKTGWFCSGKCWHSYSIHGAYGYLVMILECLIRGEECHKDNVVIDESHHALLTDFGLSKEIIDGESNQKKWMFWRGFNHGFKGFTTRYVLIDKWLLNYKLWFNYIYMWFNGINYIYILYIWLNHHHHHQDHHHHHHHHHHQESTVNPGLSQPGVID